MLSGAKIYHIASLFSFSAKKIPRNECKANLLPPPGKFGTYFIPLQTFTKNAFYLTIRLVYFINK